MKNKILLAVLTAMMVLAVALPAAAKGLVSYTFDGSSKPFSVSSDDLSKVYSMSYQTEDASPLGRVPNGFVALKARPTSTQSAVWMAAQTEMNLDEGSNDINLSVQTKNVADCKTCILVAYVGTQAPTKAGQFSSLISAMNPVLGQNWTTFYYKATIKVAKATPLYIAVGWRINDDMLKKTGTVGFDNICLTVAPTP